MAPALIRLAWLLLCSYTPLAYANVMVIIDDLGNQPLSKEYDLLPTEVTFAILPHTPYAEQIAAQAKQQQREIMLHMPMQARNDKAMGPLGISSQDSNTRIKHSLMQAITSLPGIRGVNNHMGSLLTSQERAMQVVMKTLKQQQLYFIDSRTTAQTVAATIAAQHNVPHDSRDIFLDNDRSYSAQMTQLLRAISLAKQKQHVTIIAHPYPTTITFLNQTLSSELTKAELALVSPSQYFRQQFVTQGQ